MMLSIFDLVLAGILIGFAVTGFSAGLIKKLGQIIGLIIGTWLASHYYLTIYSWLKWLFFGQENLGKIICFILIIVLASRLIGLLFWFLDKVFNFIAIIPFLKSINKISGAILGLIEGLMFLGLIFYIVSRYTPLSTFASKLITGSQITPWLFKVADLLDPLFPTALKLLKSWF
jgi:uncharacterized membrane protein required for colicin V production